VSLDVNVKPDIVTNMQGYTKGMTTRTALETERLGILLEPPVDTSQRDVNIQNVFLFASTWKLINDGISIFVNLELVLLCFWTVSIIYKDMFSTIFKLHVDP
jgi:hypothetical protein